MGRRQRVLGLRRDMKPGEYATQYRQFVTQFRFTSRRSWSRPARAGTHAILDLGWTNGFFERCRAPSQPGDGFSSISNRFPQQQNESRGFSSSRLVRRAARRDATEAVIEAQWKAMGKYDPQHPRKL